MPLALLMAALAGYVYALLAFPGFRRWGLGLAAAASLAVVLAGDRQARPAIPPGLLTLDTVTVERAPRGARMAGRVLNGSSDFRLVDMTLRLRLRDCPDLGLPAAECPVIGEAEAIARPDAPASQIRGFAASFTFTSLPPLTGSLAWDWEVVATRASPR